MKKICLLICSVLFCIFLIGASKPSLDGRAVVADAGELPSGLFAKSPGYLPGDIVVVTNPQTNISIEVMIFGSFDATEGIAIVLSPEAAKELYISKGSNVIVQVTKKSDAYSEKTVLSKTLETYVPEKRDEFEDLLEDPFYKELLKEEISNEEIYVAEDNVEIPEEDLLFEEILAEETVTEEILEPVEEEIVEVLPEETVVEEILEPVEEEIVEVLPEEVEIEEILEPVEEEIVEVLPEETEVEEILEPVEEEIVEVLPEETEEILEPVEEEIVEVLPEETEVEEILEPVEEEIVEVLLEETEVEEILEPVEEEIVEVLPEETEVEEILEPVEEEIAEILPEEFVAEMDSVLEDEVVEEIEEEAVLIPAEPKPPVFTIIPVVAEEDYEEIIEDYDSLYDEPEVIIVEEYEDLEVVEEVLAEEVPEVRAVVPVEEILEVVPMEVVKPAVNTVSTLEAKKYYVQIATYGKVENVEKALEQYGKNYPIVVYQPAGRNDYQVMIGGLNKDEYGIVLQRFRKAGFKDAFLRSTF